MKNNKLIRQLFDIPIPVLTDDIKQTINNGVITPLELSDKNRLITDTKIQNEVGYTKLPSGTWLVAMTNKMPNVTIDMINWWFWWHPQANERYQVWYPGEHLGISVKEKEVFQGEYKGVFPLPCTHYPKERVGKIKTELSIEFVSPNSYGFDVSLFDKHKIGEIICGHVGILRGRIEHTYMAHVFKVNEEGLTIISRFWLGETLPSFLQKLVFNKKQADYMAIHCWHEYSRLSEILPVLYNEYKLEKYLEYP